MTCAIQTVSTETELLDSFRDNVAEDLQLLAALHDHEPDAALLKDLKLLNLKSNLTLVLNTEPGKESMALMQHALSSLPDDPDQTTLDELAADYASIYLNHNISASPEESVWLDEDSLMCQQSMFQVRSWYESHGLCIPDWRCRPDDHLVYELQFVARLLNQDNQVETLKKVATFMDEHLLRWLGNFGQRVAERCDTAYFAGAAALTAAYCEELRDIIAEVLQQPRPTREEIDERMQPRQAPEEIPVAFTPGIGPVV